MTGFSGETVEGAWRRIAKLAEESLQNLEQITICRHCKYYEYKSNGWGRCGGAARSHMAAFETMELFGCILWKGK